MPTQAYRLRIRSADGLTDTLVLTSLRGGTNPYIANVPSGDGQEVDLLTGAVRTGAYVVEVVDAVTGSDSIGTLRIVTNKLYDGTEEYLLLENGDKILLENGDFIELEGNNAEFGRPHLLSRKAFLEMSADDGNTWTVWQSGYLTNVRQVDAIRYAFTVSNTRRVEQTKQLFTWSDSAERVAFPKRGCVVGGPIIGGFGVGGDKTSDSGGWEFAYLNTTGNASVPVAGDTIALEYRAGYFWPQWERKVIPGPNQATNFWNVILPYRQLTAGDKSLTGADWNGLTQDIVPEYPQLLAVITYTSGGQSRTLYGSVRSLFPYNTGDPFQNPFGASDTKREPFISGGYYGRLYVELDPKDPLNRNVAWDALPARNAITRVRLVARRVDETSPLYVDDHPVAIAKSLYELIGINVDANAAQTVTDAIGTTTRVALRITKPETMADFLESALFGPFGFAARTTEKVVSGVLTPVVEFFTTRMLSDSAPTLTINDSDVVGDTPPAIYDLDEATVVTGFTIEQQALFKRADVQGNTTTPPADEIMATTQVIPIVSGDTSTFSTRVVEYKIPGMVHEYGTWTTTLEQFAYGIAWEGFDRFGRGAPAMEVQVLRTSAAAAAQIGDLVYLNVGYFPNKNYRIGESSVGARVAQIVRREERPEGPMFKLVDAGSYNQPALAPGITLAASTVDPRRIAQFTITNGGALNNANEITLAVEWATGNSQPTGRGTVYARYQGGQIPTTPVLLPPVTPGSTVYVRARTEQAGLFPSAWTPWQTLALTAWIGPISTAVSSITNQSALVTWSLNGNSTDAIDVFVAPGSVAPSNWQPYRVNSFPAQTTRAAITNLTPSTTYIAGVAFRDVVGDTRGIVDTATFSTGASAVGTASRPAGLAIIPGLADATLPQGVALAMYAATGEADIVIERAPNTVVGGNDTPGTYSNIATVSATSTVYIDALPTTGTKYWYRLRHQTSGKNDSTATSGVLAIATGIPQPAIAPNAVAPIVTVSTSESGTTATATITVTDPQYRLQQVRFREQTNGGGWSAWTVDSTVPYTYSATIPTTGFVEIEYEVTGYSADGVSRILAAGVESFDTNLFANIVSATGTFGFDGSLVLAIQADTDTNSFKYVVATTPWVDDAAAYTAAQAGTLVNARNATITLPGPYAIDSTVYVAIAAYTGASGGGTASGPYRYAFLNSARDTIPLMGRARVTATSASTITVRYAVACAVAPSPNTASIAYTVEGISGVTPTSPQTVTPQLANVVSETAGSYVDFTVPRPAAGAPSGRITFTVTATDRVADTDSVDVPATGLVYSLCEATQTAATATSITVTVNASADGGTPQVRLKALTGTATRTSGATVGTLVASGSSWTFARGAFDTGPSQAQFESVLAGTINDIDFIEIPEQGRDTVPLLTRARVTATTASNVTVRVAVADPYPQGTNSVTLTYQTLGLGVVTPTSPQSITPDATLTEAAGTYVDFTVPRPAAGAGMGRITFTASASGRVSDADAVDIVPAILVYSLCEATQTNATDTSIEVTVTASSDNGTPQVRYTGLDGTATKFSGPALNVLSPSGTTWVFTRGAFNTGPSQASFESVLAGSVTDIDFITIPEEQRDTVPLIGRARVTAVDADYVTVRVAVADPYPQGANSATIAYSITGLATPTQTSGSALPNPITVTPEATIATPEASGTYYDFKVARPTNGTAPGRITFTVTAANRTSDSDAADIVPKNPVPASLTVNYTASDTEYVITWSVGTGDTATVSIDGGAFATPAASPITVARAPYDGGSDKVYTFKSVGVGGDVLTSSVTVSKQLPYVSNPATVNITSIVKDSSTSFTTTWTFSNMPSGATWTISYRVFDVGTGTGTTSNIALGTSPKTYQFTNASGLGTGSVVRVTVVGKDSSGATVASDTDTVTF